MPLSVQRVGVLFYRSASPFVEKKVAQFTKLKNSKLKKSARR